MLHGLPVHDRYGERTIEHDPYQHEFVHGTNCELGVQHAAPVIEHNPHAFAAAEKKPTHKGDLKKSPAPKEVFPKKDDTKKTTEPAEKKTAPKKATEEKK